MRRERLSAVQRKEVAERAGGRCEYCRAPSSVSPAAFEAEHILPVARGGTNAPDNLAFSCPGCNAHKQAGTESTDPETGDRTPLFHPRRDRWQEHFAWSEDGTVVVGRTPVGRATVERLQLNRSGLINLRRVLATVGEHPPEDAV